MGWFARLMGDEPITKTRLRITAHSNSENRSYYRGVIETTKTYFGLDPIPLDNWNPILVTSIEDRYVNSHELIKALEPFSSKVDEIVYPDEIKEDDRGAW